MNLKDLENLMSVSQFARKLKVSQQWIWQCVQDSRLSVVRVGGVPYINKDAKIKPKGKKIPI